METIRGVTVPANYGSFEHLFERCEIGGDVVVYTRTKIMTRVII